MGKATYIYGICLALVLLACSGEGRAWADTEGGDTIPLVPLTVGGKTYLVADREDTARVFRPEARPEKCFFLVSKRDYRLYVCETVGGDTLLAARYPICYALHPEAKRRRGDMRTPECSMSAPFYICQIKSARTWVHDFHDGRGAFPAYGAWFLRLDLSKSDAPEAVRGNRTIGIHGSTGNRESVPGRDSEGCVRLRDEDLIDLKQRFARVGTPVVITHETLPLALQGGD